MTHTLGVSIETSEVICRTFQNWQVSEVCWDPNLGRSLWRRPPLTYLAANLWSTRTWSGTFLTLALLMQSLSIFYCKTSSPCSLANLWRLCPWDMLLFPMFCYRCFEMPERPSAFVQMSRLDCFTDAWPLELQMLRWSYSCCQTLHRSTLWNGTAIVRTKRWWQVHILTSLELGMHCSGYLT